jgi:hypothetical protein
MEGKTMFNMATMAADECSDDSSALDYRDWLNRAGNVLGHYIVEGSQEESDLFDLYSDGCMPREAATELRAQQALAAA